MQQLNFKGGLQQSSPDDFVEIVNDYDSGLWFHNYFFGVLIFIGIVLFVVSLFQTKNTSAWKVLSSMAIGTGLFYIFYGFTVLDFTYDRWLYYGYAETDNIQHYAGWLAFRNSPWDFPIGKISTLSYPVRTQVSFMDSIPIVAIVAKIFSPVLPECFQYFGAYVLLCLILQAYAAIQIFSCFSKKKFVIVLQALPISFAPIMLERAFRHTALASHFLVLFSLYLYFYAKRVRHSGKEWFFVLLTILSVLIHPYFLPMVMGLLFATELDLPGLENSGPFVELQYRCRIGGMLGHRNFLCRKWISTRVRLFFYEYQCVDQSCFNQFDSVRIFR